MSVRSLISSILPDTTGNNGKVLKVSSTAGDLAWTDAPAVTSISVVDGYFGKDVTSATYTGLWLGSTNAAAKSVDATTKFAIISNTAGTTTWIGAPSLINLQVGGSDLVSVQNASPSLRLSQRLRLGTSSDNSSYSGIWMSTVSSSSNGITYYNLLGDDTGNTWLSAPSATGTITFSTQNNNKGWITSGGCQWNMRVYVDAYTTTGSTMTNLAFTTVVFGTEIWDRGSNYDPSTGTFTAPIGGVYLVRAGSGITFPAATANVTMTTSIYINGAEHTRGNRMDITTPAGIGTEGTEVTGYVVMNTNDTLLIKTYQSSGANRTLNGVATDNRLQIVGPF